MHTGKPEYEYSVEYLSVFDGDFPDVPQGELTNQFKENLVLALLDDGISDHTVYDLDSIQSQRNFAHTIVCTTKEAADQLPEVVDRVFMKTSPQYIVHVALSAE